MIRFNWDFLAGYVVGVIACAVHAYSDRFLGG